MVGIAIAVIAVTIIAGVNFVVMDMMSYTATGSEMLTPAGAVVGRALVVYDPGVSGAAKGAAVKIAGDLRSKGYTVDLAGVRSEAAGNVSGYGIIAVGGPIYGGVTSKSITAYLKALTPPKDTKVGIFATGGLSFNNTIPWYEQDKMTISEEVSGIWHDSSFNNTPIIKVIQGDKADKDCTDFVSALVE